jgi:hypothetical protein
MVFIQYRPKRFKEYINMVVWIETEVIPEIFRKGFPVGSN